MQDRDELAAELTALHQQLYERDAVFAHCEEEIRARDEHLAALQQSADEAQAHIAHLTREIETMQATRAWKLAESYWSLRSRVRGVFSRG